MANLKLYGVVGRASSWDVKVKDSTATSGGELSFGHRERVL